MTVYVVMNSNKFPSSCKQIHIHVPYQKIYDTLWELKITTPPTTTTNASSMSYVF